MIKPIDSAYLPGWEYNRVLADSPLTPRNSALPGGVFWNGAAVFWMFDKVYCTQESLDNERYASERLGWATSRAFIELSERTGIGGKVLHGVNWSSNPTLAVEIENAHRRLKLKYPDREVRSMIDASRDAELEQINHAMLEPLAAEKNAVVVGTMNGLSQWIAPRRTTSNGAPPDADHESADARLLTRQAAIESLLRKLNAPLARFSPQTGIAIMRPQESWGVSVIAAQNEARRRVETPYIRDLIAGEGDYAGAQGFVPYVDRAMQCHAMYRKADEFLDADWSQHRKQLMKLREIASVYLWPQLHGQWLPALMEDNEDAMENFPRYLSTALASRHFASILNLNTRLIIQVASVAALGLSAAGAFYDPIATSHLVKEGAGVVALAAGASAFKSFELPPEVRRTALFYQKAFKAVAE